MTPGEIGSLAVAALSLFVAGLAAYRTYALSHHQLRLGSRHEFQKLLLEMNKELVRDPELWGVYDSHPMAHVHRDEPIHTAKLEAFAYMMLNIFQIVFVYSAEKVRTSAPERAFFAAWEGTLKDFVCGSSLAREILFSRPDSGLIYDQRFLDHAKSLTKG
jgi:hypothetical protein